MWISLESGDASLTDVTCRN